MIQQGYVVTSLVDVRFTMSGLMSGSQCRVLMPGSQCQAFPLAYRDLEGCLYCHLTRTQYGHRDIPYTGHSEGVALA